MIYLEPEQREELEAISNDPEQMSELPDVVQALIRLFFMWEDA